MKKILEYGFISFIFLAASFNIVHAQNTSGHALQFYGTTADVKGVLLVPLDNPETKANVGNTDITIEWWMRSNPGDNVSPICDPTQDHWKKGNIIFDRNVDGAEDYGSYGISLSDGKISFGVSNGNQNFTLCALTRVDDGKWHHIAITRNLDGLVFLFVDGGIETQYQGPQGTISYRSGRTLSNTYDPYLIIGGEKNLPGEDSRSFVGMLDELRVSNIQRYNDAFLPPTTLFTPDINTVLLYHFEDCEDSTVLDSSTSLGGPLNPTMAIGGDPSGPIHVLSTAPVTNPPGINVCITPTSAVSCALKAKGDSNCDNQVNLEDFEIWRKEFTGAIDSKNADFTNDSQVSLADFEIWRKGFLNEF